MIYLYRLLYLFLFLFHIPKLLFVNRRVFFRRLFPKIPLHSIGPCVWVHAVSMGEVTAVAPVVKALQKSHPDWRFVISTITDTGLRTAASLFSGTEHIIQMPFDFRNCIRKMLRLGDPFLVILSEGDVWPVFLHEVRVQGAQVVLVNGKISDRTVRRLLHFPRFGKWLYSFIDLFCLQNQMFFDRFCALGIDQKKMRVTGSTKADVNIAVLSVEEKRAWRQRLGIQPTDRVIVVGSTHDPEEKQILRCLFPILEQDSTCKVLLVPRHPERFDEVFEALCVPAVRYSVYESSQPWSIMVVDQVGMLTLLYQLADLAVVAGSFVERIGGHNILEPAAVGVPVIVGPFMHSQRMLFESAFSQKAVIQVSLDDLCSTVSTLLRDESLRKQEAQKALSWANTLRGATQRTVNAVSELYL